MGRTWCDVGEQRRKKMEIMKTGGNFCDRDGKSTHTRKQNPLITLYTVNRAGNGKFQRKFSKKIL